MKPRDYQIKAAEALYRYFDHNGGNPVLEAPTAAGKSVIQAIFIRGLLQAFPHLRVVCLTHVKELIEQNAKAMQRAWPDADIGIYSAGLRSRDTENRVLFAGIQSVHNKAHELGARHLVFIDEAHLCPAKTSDGMYRNFLDGLKRLNPKIKVIGFTATPYRLDGGYLHEGENRLFTDLIPASLVDMSIDDLLAAGYLCPLTTAPVTTQLDVSGVGTRQGDYVISQLADAVDVDETTQKICAEIVRLGQFRESWLVFAVSVQHAEHITQTLCAMGISARTVTGDTPSAERDRLITECRAGNIRCLVNVGVLTTGTDIPNLDLLAFCRPTQSPGLYIQMAGRGMRIHPGKQNCLVLDFAGLIEKHGPVNDVTPPRKKGKGEGEAPLKECPDCLALLSAGVRVCPECGHKWEIERRIELSETASPLEILASGGAIDVYPTRFEAHKHRPKGQNPPSVRIDYYQGLTVVAKEWVCIYHVGYAGQTAALWWGRWIGVPIPEEIADAVYMVNERLSCPHSLTISKKGKFTEILGRSYRENAA